MKRIAIIGNGGFGREVYWQMRDSGYRDLTFFVDDEFVTENSKPLSTLTKDYEVLVAIGSPSAREQLVNRLPQNTAFHTFIHHSVHTLCPNIVIGEGSIICAGSTLTTNIHIGKHCHLNLNTTIGHDCVIGDYFTTAPAVNISGNCTIGNRVYFGTNSAIREKLSVADDVIVGLNGGVVKNILESGTYVGSPVKKLNI